MLGGNDVDSSHNERIPDAKIRRNTWSGQVLAGVALPLMFTEALLLHCILCAGGRLVCGHGCIC